MAFYSMSQFRERVRHFARALRFYESRGLITPQRKEGSNYRVYSDMDGLGVLRIKIMQSFACRWIKSRERSKEISLAEQDAYLTQVEMHMEEQLRHVQNELARIRKNHSFVRDAMGAQGEVCELDTYGIYKLMLLGEGVQRGYSHGKNRVAMAFAYADVRCRLAHFPRTLGGCRGTNPFQPRSA